MTLCESCCWWGVHNRGLSTRKCGHMKMQMGPSVKGEGEIPNDVCTPHDSQDWYAWLETGPKFGCVHGEEKT